MLQGCKETQALVSDGLCVDLRAVQFVDRLSVPVDMELKAFCFVHLHLSGVVKLLCMCQMFRVNSTAATNKSRSTELQS